MISQPHLLAFINWAICTAIGVIVVCRLNAMRNTVLHRVRWEYAVYLTSATISGFSPWFGEWPGYARISMAASFLLGLLCSAHAWERDTPPTIASGYDDLHEADSLSFEDSK